MDLFTLLLAKKMGGGGDIPEALPNPYALTLTGAVTASYDGSEAVSVEIPGDGYIKPDSGIPKSDLSNEVQTSLSKADTALQEHQDISGKVDKVEGKGLSTNDYTNADKSKVDAIPENPKYTDTVYDDTALKNRVSAIEEKESTWDNKLNKSDIVQTTGQSTTSIMSQKAATVEINSLKSDITDLQTALIGVSDLIGGDA